MNVSPVKKPLLLVLLYAMLLVLLSPGTASAHLGEQSYLYLNVTTDELSGQVEFPYEDITEVFGLGLDGDSEAEVISELEANLPQLHRYIQAHTAIGDASEEWELTFSGVELLDSRADGSGIGYAIFPFTVELPLDAVPRDLQVTFDPFFDEIDDRDAVVLVANDWLRGVFDEERNRLVVLDQNTRSAEVDLGKPSQWLNFTGSVKLGLDHIRTGPDHIFFVLVLLLPAVMVLATTWRPAPSFGSALWRVLKISSTFTLAHSITFTLAGLDLLPLPPSWIVESIIAISISAAALHNLKPVLQDREWLIAFAFGLFHGMGFASLVQTLDVGRKTQLISLLGRNVGIEIGQVIVVLLAFPALFLLRRTLYFRPVFVLGSLALAAISFVWAVERLFSVDLNSDALVEPLVYWPRSGIAMVAVTVLAALVWRTEDKSGRLEPVFEPGSVDRHVGEVRPEQVVV